MMVDGAEESQLKGPIDVLAPYTLERSRPARGASRPVVIGHDGTVSDFIVTYLDSIDERLLEYLDENEGCTALASFAGQRCRAPGGGVRLDRS
jgi:hypothetical protein